MFLLPVFCPVATDLTGRFQYLSWFKVFPASLITFISSCRFFTVGTDSLKVPIGQELLTFCAVCLLNYLRVYITPVNQPADKMFCPSMGGWIIGHPEVIKVHLHLGEGVREMGMIPFRYLAGSCTFLFGTHDDWRSMIIRAADKDHLFSFSPHEPHVKIRRYICPEMAEMAGAVGIGKATGNKKWAAIHQVHF
jgi:hypothetical protein